MGRRAIHEIRLFGGNDRMPVPCHLTSFRRVHRNPVVHALASYGFVSPKVSPDDWLHIYGRSFLKCIQRNYVFSYIANRHAPYNKDLKYMCLWRLVWDIAFLA